MQHLAIIMDGNRRWSKKNGVSLVSGYKKGSEVIIEVINHLLELGIPYLTVYAFSSENWNRPIREIASLMNLGVDWLDSHLGYFQENGVRCSVLGNRGLIPYSFLNRIEQVEAKTSGNQKLNFQIALSYGSRDEILRAAAKIANMKIKSDQFSESFFAQFLDTKNMPDPDLLIRTGGQHRLSNYMLWQLAYTELRFIDTLWPDFTKAQLSQLFENYYIKDRSFGYL